MNIEHTGCFRVYIEDTDSMGIVYHANYLRFFERARTDLLRSQGLSLSLIMESGFQLVINEIHVRYYSPARLDDVLHIVTHFKKKRTIVFEFQQFMYNQQQICLSEIKVDVISVDKNLKPKRLPKEFEAILNNE